jgi:phage tail tube protein FII
MSYTLEELKTYCGYMMEDLRGNWAFNYVDRIEELNSFLQEICNHKDSTETDKANALVDINLGLEELESDFKDGRIYRDCAIFYGYKSDEGLTKQIYTKLSEDMTYPEEYLPNLYQILE